MDARRRRLLPLALAGALILTPLLAGCNPADIVDKAVEEATGGDVSLGGELPDDWPAEIPVVDGTVLFGASGQDGGWVVTIDATGTDPVADAKAQLEEAGFTPDADAQAPDGAAGFASLSNDAYRVVVAGSDEGVVYTVTPLG